ncbi:uncharacterized protein F5891DRAFT_977760 [Suillus fuscotomentosus]|uniref:Uncharacterized protein n=1 Tax=Suillus fuscotomentosus TaxID=1912939 RepID=A0AAD4HMZ6_9AGAM|nr:uncharacterized protein F5891DRAFT_977760 [Suillus fuscotomentosus]KAG1903660.1 hypothetical protein F5891DRAFT_977760 [Suillus fuscotomentosus]
MWFYQPRYINRKQKHDSPWLIQSHMHMARQSSVHEKPVQQSSATGWQIPPPVWHSLSALTVMDVIKAAATARTTRKKRHIICEMQYRMDLGNKIEGGRQKNSAPVNGQPGSGHPKIEDRCSDVETTPLGLYSGVLEESQDRRHSDPAETELRTSGVSWMLRKFQSLVMHQGTRNMILAADALEIKSQKRNGYRSTRHDVPVYVRDVYDSDGLISQLYTPS